MNLSEQVRRYFVKKGSRRGGTTAQAAEALGADSIRVGQRIHTLVKFGKLVDTHRTARGKRGIVKIWAVPGKDTVPRGMQEVTVLLRDDQVKFLGTMQRDLRKQGYKPSDGAVDSSLVVRAVIDNFVQRRQQA